MTTSERPEQLAPASGVQDKPVTFFRPQQGATADQLADAFVKWLADQGVQFEDDESKPAG